MVSDMAKTSEVALKVRIASRTLNARLAVSTGSRASRLVLEVDGLGEYSGEGLNAWDAFIALRRKCDGEGITIGCNAARRDFRMSGMTSDMGGGLSGYLRGEDDTAVHVPSFDPADLDLCISQDYWIAIVNREEHTRLTQGSDEVGTLAWLAERNPGKWVWSEGGGTFVGEEMPTDPKVSGAWHVGEDGVRDGYFTNPNRKGLSKQDNSS